jgi:hypothetical protein
MNYLMVQNLKDTLAVIRTRLSRIEQRRPDYNTSRSWVALKVKEEKIIKKIEEFSKNRLTK